MSRFRRIGSTLVAGVALVVAACGDNPNPTSPDGVLASRAQSPQSDETPSAAELNAQVPGFGGFFLDQEGNPTIYLTRGAARGNAERALERFLRTRGGASALRVREAKYSWGNLERWQAAATPEALALSGAVFVDNDETSNRVVIGVEDLGTMGEVRGAVARAGLPDDAVLVEQADPILQLALATLQNVVDRPVRAGVQINFPGYLCSVGYNATLNGQASFVTASHCTNTQGGTEGTPYWQPLQSVDPTQIATEVNDPVYFKNKNGCPRGRRCRFSDASRAAYVDGNNQALGLIARTASRNVYGSSGYLDITGSFTITSEDLTNNVAVGQQVDKVGRTTGWTGAAVSNTCVNTGVSGTNIVQLCQTFVSSTGGVVIVLGGDSGSGTFQTTGVSSVRLVGSLWGGNGSGTLFVYSPLKNVVQELGALSVR